MVLACLSASGSAVTSPAWGRIRTTSSTLPTNYIDLSEKNSSAFLVGRCSNGYARYKRIRLTIFGLLWIYKILGP